MGLIDLVINHNTSQHFFEEYKYYENQMDWVVMKFNFNIETKLIKGKKIT